MNVLFSSFRQEGKELNFTDLEAFATAAATTTTTKPTDKLSSTSTTKEERGEGCGFEARSSRPPAMDPISPFPSFQSSSSPPSPPHLSLSVADHDDGGDDFDDDDAGHDAGTPPFTSYGGLDVGDHDDLDDDGADDDPESALVDSITASVEIDDEDGVLAFYEEISHRKGPPLRHFSMSEESFRSIGSNGTSTSNSSEKSPLLLKNPLKGLTRNTPTQLWLYRAWKVYGQALDRRPVTTKSITACIIVALGDVVGQYVQGPEEGETKVHFDYVRFCRFASMGMFLQAPITHYYYEALDKYFPPTEHPWTKTTFIKLAIDQAFYAPGFLLCVFVYLGLLEGSSWTGIGAQLQENYFTTLVANWKLWIPATLINLAYCAPRYRVLYCNVIFFAWSIFLSLVLSPAGIKNG